MSMTRSGIVMPIKMVDSSALSLTSWRPTSILIALQVIDASTQALTQVSTTTVIGMARARLMCSSKESSSSPTLDLLPSILLIHDANLLW